MSDNEEIIRSLAREILILSRNTLLVNLRFLDMALSRFVYYPTEKTTLATDGRHLLYSPRHILRYYKNENTAPVRDYLHTVLHCVYRHMFAGPSIDRARWDLACDAAVENIIAELGLSSTASIRERSQTEFLTELRNRLKSLTAERIYAYLLDKDYDENKISRLRQSFLADDHTVWYMSPDEKQSVFGAGIMQGGGNEQQNDGNAEDTGSGLSSGTAELIEDWKYISGRMQQDLETFSKNIGTKAGSMMQNLAEINREKYDYTAFLKKFAVLGEAMKINDDEFDYIFYTYGLTRYGNMPLIEPLEYKDVRRIREFVIAIDTSGSVAGETVQTFLQKTYNILKSTESFFSKINLHIIQCDAEIREHVKITSQDEFDEYIRTMTIRGLGGTDFRPVFETVNELIASGEFTNLKGLIYFTDGFGTFPEKKPDYRTAFVFIEDDFYDPDVPSWAIKLILQKNQI